MNQSGPVFQEAESNSHDQASESLGHNTRGPTYLNLGTGCPCAWHCREKLEPADLIFHLPASSPANLGPERPTGSRYPTQYRMRIISRITVLREARAFSMSTTGTTICPRVTADHTTSGRSTPSLISQHTNVPAKVISLSALTCL